MDIEVVREYCLSLPGVVEDFPFDESTLVFRVANKIFAYIDLEHPQWLTLKCDHCVALELRERYSEIDGAWHWNKKYWDQVDLYGCLKDEFVKSLIRHSYSEVVKKLSKSVKMENPKLLSVKSEVFLNRSVKNSGLNCKSQKKYINLHFENPNTNETK